MLIQSECSRLYNHISDIECLLNNLNNTLNTKVMFTYAILVLYSYTCAH